MAKQEDSGHSFLAYFKRATSPLAVLRILSDRPMYGYELIQELKQRSGGKYQLSLLYPVLYRLEEQGYLEISSSEIVDGRARICRYTCRTGLSAADAGRVCRDFRCVSAADGGLGRT